MDMNLKNSFLSCGIESQKERPGTVIGMFERMAANMPESFLTTESSGKMQKRIK